MRDEEHRAVKCLSVSLSVISMLSAIGVIGFSIRALVEFGYVSVLIGSNVLMYGSVTMLVVGVAAFTLTPIGLYSTILQKQSLMTLYMLCIFGVGGFSMAGGGLGYLMKLDIVNHEVKSWIADSLTHEYGNPYEDEITKAWDRLQQQLVCCGVEENSAGADWFHSDWLTAQTIFPRKRIPTSCCPTCGTVHEKFCYEFLLHPPNKTQFSTEERICLHAGQKCSDALDIFPDVDVCTGRRMPPKDIPKDAYVHTRGCYKPLEEELLYYANKMMNFGFIFAGLMFCSSVVTLILSHLNGDTNYASVSS